MNSITTATGSRTTDRAIFGALVVIMVCASPRLLVYHRSMQVGTTRVVLAAIDSAGTRVSLAAPSIQGQRVRATLHAIDSLARTVPVRTMTPLHGHLEWTLHYSTRNGYVSRPVVRVVTTRR